MFISLDGIDGVGKSTQIANLVQHLESAGHSVLSVRDPGSTDIGARLRAILLDSDLEMHRRTEAMLFMASRCEMIEETIRPALKAGKTVISDRFLLATVVYQSTPSQAKNQSQATSSVAPETVWKIGALANDGLRPDLTILLDMPAATAVSRMNGPADRMESRGVEYMETVRQAFLKELPNASEHTAIINADQSPQQVCDDVIAQVNPLL